ncbi:MAG: hypothetical protein U1A22_11725, partial [Xanthomonadaceae bacterium]|nr:hypothetical protein [Xanthomonadaceae bacterium]
MAKQTSAFGLWVILGVFVLVAMIPREIWIAMGIAVAEVSPHLSLQNPHVGRNQAVCAHRLCNTGGYLDHRGQADARSPSIAP